MAGVYANFANVSHSDYEFTITFARVDHEVDSGEIPGIIVSRVNLSPRFMRELIAALRTTTRAGEAREGIKSLPEFEGTVGESEPRRRRGVRAPRARLRVGDGDADPLDDRRVGRRAAPSASAADRDRRGSGA